MNRHTTWLCIGAILFLAFGLAAAIRHVPQAVTQDGPRERLVTRGLVLIGAGQDQSSSIRERIRQWRRAASNTGAQNLEIAGLQVSVWRPLHTPSGPAPLVIFSHGFHGVSTQSTFLMKALAEHGYLVIAPNHKDSLQGGRGTSVASHSAPGFGNPAAWSDSTYKDRAEDITSLLRTLKTDPAWSAAIDWSRVALAGHSLGGYTVLGLAGGWPSWKLPGVKAVLALSPYSLPFSLKRSLGSLHVPVMYQGGTWDIGITPFVKNLGGAFEQTSAPAYFVEFNKAGHFAWTDLNPIYQNSIIYYSLAFLDKYVKGDSAADPTRKLPDVSQLWAKQ